MLTPTRTTTEQRHQNNPLGQGKKPGYIFLLQTCFCSPARETFLKKTTKKQLPALEVLRVHLGALTFTSSLTSTVGEANRCLSLDSKEPLHLAGLLEWQGTLSSNSPKKEGQERVWNSGRSSENDSPRQVRLHRSAITLQVACRILRATSKKNSLEHSV